ncbi:lamin tail domain-containing protein [Candidatus Uhrbacteria bacterium]|nr:lamin tail domain-containing protein [Candidatus Uhrbacteria bacterium]
MLKLFDYRWLAVVMLLTVAALPVRIQAQASSVVFSEIAWAGSSISSSDEWIELTNVSDTTIDLSGWTLAGAGSSDAIFTLPEGAVVEPYSTYVIANYEYTHANSALDSAPDFVTTTLSLSNNGFSLTLTDAQGTVMDVAGGSGAPFAGRSGGTGDSVDGRYASMVRVDGIIDGSLEESWIDAETSFGFKTGVEDLGTPGVMTFATVEPEVVEETVEEMPDEGVVPEEPEEETAGEESVEIPLEEQTETTLSTETTVTNIRINEFVVDPSGDGVEWIELYNAGESSVTLDGWSIEDESGGTTDLSDITMEPSGYVVIESPKGKLNNDGDTVTLIDMNGSIVETVTYGGEGYPAPKDGESLARNGETFEVTQVPTPGGENIISVAMEEVANVEETEETEQIEQVVEDEEETESAVVQNETEESQVEEVIEEAVIIKTLRFITLYPNATGSDEEEEYLVIENTGVDAIDLLGWSIEDASTDRYTFDSSVMIEAGTTLTLGRPESKLTLNNSGDTLELTAPDGEVVDLVTYGTSTKGATYDLVDGIWVWSGTTTVVESTVTESTVTESATTSASATTSSTISNSTHSPSLSFPTSPASSQLIQFIPIAQAKEKLDGQKVVIKGVVISTPGTFGSQIFYLQDETGGIQIYLYSSDFPHLLVGDVIQVSGEMSTSRGERRVKLSGSANILSASGSLESGATDVSIGDVRESLVGMLLTTTGMIQSIDTNKLVIEQMGTTLTIYLKSNPMIDPNQFTRGDTIEVTGILTTYDGEFRLRPRSKDDIQMREQTPVAGAIVSENTAGGSNTGLILLFSTLAALGGLALWRYMPRRRLTPVNA